MNQLRLGLRENRTAFAPGETIAGAADWAWEEAPKEAEVRLCWLTQGKGTEDAEVVQTVALANPRATDLRQFSFAAPEAPYSFSGKLISLIWAVEVVLQPGDVCERVEIVIAPERREVVLTEG
jgi:hypothetical protein